MIYILVIATALWILGHALSVPYRARWLMIGLLYLAVLAVLVLWPKNVFLQSALGGTLGEWVALGMLAALVLIYRQGLVWVKSKAPKDAPAPETGAFREAEIERYARHIMLREIGGPGQKRLKDAKVLVVGAGGLGSPALMYLAAAGVGTIGVIDDDRVEATNLQRQIAHSDDRIGMAKVFSAQAAMNALNPYVRVKPYNRRLEPDIAANLVAEYDLVLDGTDSFETRYLVNAVCVAANVPLVSAALTQWEGQIGVFDPANGGPCYRCVFPEAPDPALVPTCAEAGVLGPLTGVMGAMMAVEAIKVLTGAGETLRGRLLMYDGLYGDVRVISTERRVACKDCGAT